MLKDHSDRDFGSGNARYVEWHKQGFLEVSPGRAIDPSVIATKIAELHNRYHIVGMAYDRWRMSDLLREFDRVGLASYEDSDEKESVEVLVFVLFPGDRFRIWVRR